MNEREQRRLAMRIGSGAAISAAVLGTVVNVAHGDLPEDPKAALHHVADNAMWGLLHLGYS